MGAELRVIPSQSEGVGVVELLEDALARARKGEYSSLVIVYVDREGCTGHGWSKLHSRSTQIGALFRAMNALAQ